MLAVKRSVLEVVVTDGLVDGEAVLLLGLRAVYDQGGIANQRDAPPTASRPQFGMLGGVCKMRADGSDRFLKSSCEVERTNGGAGDLFDVALDVRNIDQGVGCFVIADQNREATQEATKARVARRLSGHMIGWRSRAASQPLLSLDIC